LERARACVRARGVKAMGRGAQCVDQSGTRASAKGESAHLAVSHALMLAMSSGSLEAEAGLHFQLPPTIGRRDISLLAEESDERSRVGAARSICRSDAVN
jgi:hypothetical protein